MRTLLLALALVGCSDSLLIGEPPPPVAPPPDDPEDGTGSPPDFAQCAEGWFGQYYNLSAAEASGDADWWAGRPLAQRVDPGLTFGEAWWPVDEGLDGDPAHFAVRWTAWARAERDGDWSIALAAADEAQLLVDGEVAAEAVAPFTVYEHDVHLEAGRHTLELRYVHHTAPGGGFFFRPVAGDVVVCPPVFE